MSAPRRTFPSPSPGIVTPGPAVVISLPIESPPQVAFDILDEGEEIRLADWLAQHPRYVRLIDEALELAAEAEAA
jgi:hypothetical protein